MDAFKNGKYKAAKGMFELFTDEFKVEINACDILMNNKMSVSFIEEFKNLDENVFLLKSEERENELCRAFYFINSGCINYGHRIVKDAFDLK